MKVLTALPEGENWSDCVLTIGNFDGVHRGHQELLKRLQVQAKSRKVASALLTFYPHPVQVLYPERKLERMFDLEDLREVAESFGVDYLIEKEFTHDFAAMRAQEFLKNVVKDKLRAKSLVVGYDFSFGRSREGGLPAMAEFCEKNQMGLEIVAPVHVGGITVSSSKIRNELKLGDLKKAHEFLGRNYYLRGVVEKGFQRGRTIGVPTANIRPRISFVPRLGVYASRIHYAGMRLQGITNIGVNPTVTDDLVLKVETHLFSFSKDIYGEEIKVELLEFIRDEKKFSSIEELKAQIFRDIEQVKAATYE